MNRPYIDRDDPMEMVGHDYMDVDTSMGISLR